MNPQGDVRSITSYFNVSHRDPLHRSVVEDMRLWPEAKVHFTVSAEMTQNEKRAILESVAEITGQTCISFTSCLRCRNRIFISRQGGGCWSGVLGMRKGVQKVNLGSGCWRKGTIIHELLHAIGFYHEQSRPDRDGHVTVSMDLIKSDWRSQFHIYTGRLQAIGDFDFGSVMMYPHKHAQVGIHANRPYMVPKYNKAANQRKMGQREGLSTEDVKKIKIAYCKGRYLCSVKSLYNIHNVP